MRFMPARSRRLLRNSAFTALLAASAAHAGDARLKALVAAYPEKITRIEANVLVFRDGTRIDVGSIDPNKPMAALLKEATILDQFRLPYPKGAPSRHRRRISIPAASATRRSSTRSMETAARAM